MARGWLVAIRTVAAAYSSGLLGNRVAKSKGGLMKTLSSIN